MTRLHRIARSALPAIAGPCGIALLWALSPDTLAWADVPPGPYPEPPPLPADPGGFLGLGGGEALIIGLICCGLGGGLAVLIVAGLFLLRRRGGGHEG